MIAPVRLIVAIGMTFAVVAIASFTRFERAADVVPAPEPSSGPRIRYPGGRYPVLAMPDGGQRSVKSVLRHRRPLQYGEYLWNDAGIPAGPVWVRVDLTLQTLSIFRDSEEIGTTVILYGANAKPTPPGVYPVLERAVNHRSTLYDAEMPYMLRLTGDGVAIHASDVRAGRATHGCIGVPLGFAKRLFAEMKVGDPVAVIAADVVS